jgi:RNA polymerase sigma-70 factor, ECF subfamily
MQKPMVSNVKPARMNEEWEVIQRALGGDSDALSKLFSNEQLRLYRSALALLRNKEDAEDALQDALLSAYVNLGSFEGRSRFSTWLTRIVFNAALMNRRKVRISSQISLDELTEEKAEVSVFRIADTRPDPEQVFRQIEISHTVRKAMGKMSPKLRSTLHLRDIQHLSVKEAAKLEGVTAGVIKARSLRARKQLADLVDVGNRNF